MLDDEGDAFEGAEDEEDESSPHLRRPALGPGIIAPGLGDPELYGLPAELRCFPSAGHLQAWLNMAPRTTRPCTDCTASFQAVMISRGRCDHPEVVFRRTEAGELVGVIPPVAKDESESCIAVKLAQILFGDPGLKGLAGLAGGSLSSYRSGNRILPVHKLAVLRQAIRSGTTLLACGAETAERPREPGEVEKYAAEEATRQNT